MSPKHKPNAMIRILLSNGSLVALGALTAWLGFVTAREAYSGYKAKRNIDNLKKEIQALEGKNSNLEALIDSFGDPNIIEREAKRRLNLKKPGEEVAVILRDKNDKSRNIAGTEDARKEDRGLFAQSVDESSELSNPVKWWRYIVEGN